MIINTVILYERVFESIFKCFYYKCFYELVFIYIVYLSILQCIESTQNGTILLLWQPCRVNGRGFIFKQSPKNPILTSASNQQRADAISQGPRMSRSQSLLDEKKINRDRSTVLGEESVQDRRSATAGYSRALLALVIVILLLLFPSYVVPKAVQFIP